MKLLYANDERGEHAPSWYCDTTTTTHRPSLRSELTADVCIIGAGYSGLSAAIHAAQHGLSVTVIDAHRVGWGASGRNGGQLGTGFNQDQMQLEKSLGPEFAKELWGMSEEAKNLVHSLCKQFDLDIDYSPGIVTALHKSRFVNSAHEYASYLDRQYGYDQLDILDRDTIQDRVRSEDYHGGYVDQGAGHVHPLKLAIGMAKAAEFSGATIYEKTEAMGIEALAGDSGYRVATDVGSVVCENIVLATNGYSDDLMPTLNPWIMPINNFIVVTEPLGAMAKEILPQNDAVADSRFVVNYFRRVAGDRLLFGGGENYRYQFPQAIKPIVRKAMLGIFPQLKEAKLEYAWGGTLAITRSRLPYAKQIKKRIYTAAGFSGHGVALTGLYGKAIADHIVGDTRKFEQLSSLPTQPFPGGKAFRSLLLAGAMTGYSWLDKI